MIPPVQIPPVFEKIRTLWPWSRPQPRIGLDLGSRAITFVELYSRRGQSHVRQWGAEPLDPQIMDQGRIINRPALIEALRALIEKHRLQGASVAMGVNGASVMVKRIPVPFSHHHDLDAYVMWEGTNSIPYDPEDVYLDYAVCSPMLSVDAKAGQDLLLIAAKRDAVDERREVLEAVNLHPIICDVETLAVLNMVALNPEVQTYQAYLVAKILDGLMSLVVMVNGEPLLVREISVANFPHEHFGDWAGIQDEVHRDKDCHDSPASDSFLSETIQWFEIVRECKRTLEGAQELHPSLEVGKMFLCGSLGQSSGLVDELQKSLSLPVSCIDPVASIGWSDVSTRSLTSCAGLASGLALRVKQG